jgi:curved DNA-binding protein CbpA
MARETDHYAILGVTRQATDAEIKRRYRQLMREAHPDANAGDPAATRRAARINAAYETLGNRERRRDYDARSRPTATTPATRRSNKVYAHWAEQDDWEDIVAAAVPPKRPAHVHADDPLVEPEEIEVTMTELRATPRARRRITIRNRCTCTLRGDVSTSEPWVWGPMGKFEAAPGGEVSFDIEIVASKVRFPGISRVLFVANGWTGVVPVKIAGFESKTRRVPPAATSSAWARGRAKGTRQVRSR